MEEVKREKAFMKGCEALAEAAVRSGVRFFAGYPITPQNEIPEYMSSRLPALGGTFIQGESEIASINMVYGAAATGVRAMTSSSGPGISLKNEGISYLAAARIPALIADVSRGGPGLGSVQPAQSDYLMATKALGHGGHTVQQPGLPGVLVHGVLQRAQHFPRAVHQRLGGGAQRAAGLLRAQQRPVFP